MSMSMVNVDCDKNGRPDLPLPTPFTPPKFQPSDPAAVDYLNENGYVVYGGVANTRQVKQAIQLFWDWVTDIEPKIKMNDPATWGTRWVGARGTGIVNHSGIGQSEFLWFCRCLPGVKQAFATIWGDDKVITSFDGCGAFRPPEIRSEWLTASGWYHIDQNCLTKKGRQAVQGLLNLYPSSDDDGGLVVWPRSHKYTEELCNEFTGVICDANTGDYVSMEKSQKVWDYLKPHDLKPIKVRLDAGDFVCWDSRTIHCNHPATINATIDPSTIKTLRRLVAYICMTPVSMIKDPACLERRVRACWKGITTTHWPNEFDQFLLFNSAYGWKPVEFDQYRKLLVTADVQQFDEMWEKQLAEQEKEPDF